ncbi:TRAM domain-containing protein, partial [Candidatus Saccharibacteria bacterium]|nr:TRAM domain-containing protein [Candidatus Saccharibacteria bacterium]
LYTTDYNLAKVAAVEGVQVLNVNELAHSLRPIALPGETLKIKIVQKGSNREQGVGYLEDGTMIVIEGGARYVGREVPVSVTRMHQTVAGKMVFGQIKEVRRTTAANATTAVKRQTQATQTKLRTQLGTAVGRR